MFHGSVNGSSLCDVGKRKKPTERPALLMGGLRELFTLDGSMVGELSIKRTKSVTSSKFYIQHSELFDVHIQDHVMQYNASLKS